MLDAVERNPDWINWFDHALNPDECLFQTMFMASPFAGRERPILTYVDWSEGGSSSKVLQTEDLPSLRSRGATSQGSSTRPLMRRCLTPLTTAF